MANNYSAENDYSNASGTNANNKTQNKAQNKSQNKTQNKSTNATNASDCGKNATNTSKNCR